MKNHETLIRKLREVMRDHDAPASTFIFVCDVPPVEAYAAGKMYVIVDTDAPLVFQSAAVENLMVRSLLTSEAYYRMMKAALNDATCALVADTAEFHVEEGRVICKN